MKNEHKIIILNALLTAGIVFLSTLSVQYPPTIQNVYAAAIGAALALITQLKQYLSVEIDNINPPIFGLLIWWW